MPQDDLKRLEELIADLAAADKGPRAALLEHLTAARRDALGSMRNEYRASLQFGVHSLVCITDKRVRAETKAILQSLLDPETRKP